MKRTGIVKDERYMEHVMDLAIRRARNGSGSSMRCSMKRR